MCALESFWESLAGQLACHAQFAERLLPTYRLLEPTLQTTVYLLLPAAHLPRGSVFSGANMRVCEEGMACGPARTHAGRQHELTQWQWSREHVRSREDRKERFLMASSWPLLAAYLHTCAPLTHCTPPLRTSKRYSLRLIAAECFTCNFMGWQDTGDCPDSHLCAI